MRRSLFAIMLLCTILSAGTLSAATPGVTVAERGRALEFRKRLTTKKVPRVLGSALTQIYLRRAYMIDAEPALAMVDLLLRKKYKFKGQEQVKYFALCLDALVRGASMKAVETTLKGVMKADYGRKDNAFFIEALLGVASRQASPVPMIKLLKLVSKSGMVGRRRREFVTWILEEVKRGENPVHIVNIYEGIGKTVFSLRSQREYLTKCFDAIQRGAAPLELSTEVVRIAKQLQTERKLNEKTDEILKLHFRGTPLAEAAAKIVPPPKIEDEDLTDD